MQKNDYIIQRSAGDLWHFYHSDAEGLCLRKKKDNRWGEAEVLLDNAFFDFCALGDGNDNLHLICQDMDGSIFYLSYHHAQWHKFTLLKSKTQGAYAKHFKLLLTGTQLQLFYTIRSNQRLMLVHQLLGSPDDPTVVGVVHDSLRPFFALSDDYQNAYVYYQNEEGVLGVRCFEWSKKAFGDFQGAGVLGAESPFAYLDSFGRHHITAIARGGGLVYLQRSLEGEFCKRTAIATQADAPIYLPIILNDENRLWLLWRQGIAVYYARSSDDAESFSNPARFVSTGAAPQLYIFQRGAECTYCWGYLSGGEIHLFAAGKNEQTAKAAQGIPRPSIQQRRREGQDAEEFADRHIAEFGSRAAAARAAGQVQPVRPAAQQPQQAGAGELDLTKIKILISALGEQVSSQKKSIAQLTEKIERLEAQLRERCAGE